MARRRDDEDEGLVGEIFDLLLVAPIWVGPVVAAILYSLFRWVFPRFFTEAPKDQVEVSFILRDLFPMIAPWVAGVVLVFWLLTAFQRVVRLATTRCKASTHTSTATSKSPSKPIASTPGPACPVCGSATVLRTAQRGPDAGRPFYGCSRYPECKGILR